MPPRKINLLYISDGYKNLSVFDSQVHSICEEQGKYINVKLLALAGIKEYFLPNNSKNYLFYKSLRFPKSLISPITSLNIFFINQKKLFQWADVIHCRGHLGSYYGLLLLKKYHMNKPLIADIRGLITDEIKNSNSIIKNILYKNAEKIEKYIMTQDINYFFVSNRMKDYYYKKYKNKNIDNKSWIFPTVVNDELFFYNKDIKKRISVELGIPDDRIVVAYSGNLDYWQNFENIIMAFSEAIKFNKKLFLFVITKEREKALNIINNSEIRNSDVVLISLPYEKVGTYLQVADYGLLIRENILINQLSFPTKFGEYLNCGVRVIVTKVDADYIDIIKEKKYGEIIKNIKFLEDCLKNLEKPKDRNQIKICSLKEIAEKQRDIYFKLLIA